MLCFDPTFDCEYGGPMAIFTPFEFTIIVQVGNAVPPPMGRAIGLEIKKCLEWKVQMEPITEEESEVKQEEEMETECKVEDSPVKPGSSRC